MTRAASSTDRTTGALVHEHDWRLGSALDSCADIEVEHHARAVGEAQTADSQNPVATSGEESFGVVAQRLTAGQATAAGLGKIGQ
jgi:hypothetical protein